MGVGRFFLPSTQTETKLYYIVKSFFEPIIYIIIYIKCFQHPPFSPHITFPGISQRPNAISGLKVDTSRDKQKPLTVVSKLVLLKHCIGYTTLYMYTLLSHSPSKIHEFLYVYSMFVVVNSHLFFHHIKADKMWFILTQDNNLLEQCFFSHSCCSQAFFSKLFIIFINSTYKILPLRSIFLVLILI